MKHWNLGNTTVRNPDRIKDGLRILKKYFEGKSFSEKEHLEFFEKLLDEKIIEAMDISTLSKRSKEISGRKWVACFNQLGFSVAWKSKGVVRITDAGNALLEHDEEEVFLRQFLKYHLPSPIEHGAKYIGFNVNPFYVILYLLYELKNEGITGLTKDEISLHVITCLRNEDLDKSKKRIIEFRNFVNSIKGNVRKKEFYYEKKKQLILELYANEFHEKEELIKELYNSYKNDKDFFKKEPSLDLINQIIATGKGSKTGKAKEFENKILNNIKNENINECFKDLLELFMATKGRTLNDYADTTVRYTVKTGLLSISGNKLILKEDKLLFVKKLLDDFPKFSNEDYITNFYTSTEPYLPLDNIDFLHQNLISLHNRAHLLKSKLKTTDNIEIDVTGITNPLILKNVQKGLENTINKMREKLFYREQSKKEMIEDILSYYDMIMKRSLFGGEAYRPAYFEWTTWRLFLSINNIFNEISSTRNFNIDEELNPIHHAKSGEPDMVFEYSDFVIVCEVTLRITENQWSEEEPVPRHVAKIIEKYEKKVFGVFIAPSIDPNTVIEFYKKQRFIKGGLIDVNIIPFTLEQIKKLLIKFDRERFTTDTFKHFFEDLVLVQNNTSDALDWYKNLNKKIENWVS
ncbi:MAG: hypothetical protein A2W22_00615 [Candidatus Levybacteria bacterium RBG_16_35_11]|nr:MAG: hypothetical protein A2W22_00615 [Candidatus Levybacteria bacterium RBG_16_35_11]